MPTYNISQIIGKTMYAVKTVQVYNLPFDNQQPIRSINAGQPIGTVYSFVLPTTGRGDSYFMFYSLTGQAYYIKYESGNLRMTEGALTIQEAEESKKDWLDRLGDKLLGSTGLELSKSIIRLSTGALIIWGGSVFLGAIKTFKR